MDREQLAKSLAGVPSAKVEEREHRARGFHLDVSLSPENLRQAVSVLDQAGFFIETITGVDWLGEKQALLKQAQAAAAAKAKAAGEETPPAPVAEATQAPQPDDLEAVYDINHYDELCRVALRVRVSREAPSLPTISDIYVGALWHEREARDFFGFDFVGHPYLVPLLLPEDADFHPLRKDFQA